MVAKGEAMFSDLSFYKIVKVKRKVCDDQKIAIFYIIVTKKLIKMFKAPTLPPVKKPCNKPTFDLSPERYESEDLGVLGDVVESKRKPFS